ncbi:uncharacterized protein CDV56_103196 [Aspergillus thermomutatus]|uniref:GPI anchored protein n=1 Tax=Aspergillus thermomutatus TaxID=41047 RepID=A0A397GI18_ASPTH|nr:uncharacterized protein CDV56_103196 [Aspergillus thermomutatus]RHZ50591.1 hypothetical protein CDV56_103196 [Aspergillus thermomutatus]
MHAQSILSLTLLAAIATTAIADDIVTLFLPEFDSQSLVGKVIGIDGPLTTYVVDCNPKPKNQNFIVMGDCAASSSGFTIVHGPSTFRGVFEYPQYVGTMATVGPVEDMYQTLTITGTESASVPATAQAFATAGTATATGSTTLTTTGASTSAKETGKDTASVTSPTTAVSKSTNAAGAQVTGLANWVVGGAAAMAVVAVI